MVLPFMAESEKLAAVREALPAVGAGIYLDGATAGPLPAETAAAMAEAEAWELRTGRVHPGAEDDAAQRAAEAQAAAAAVLTVDVDDILLTHGAAEAIAIAARAPDWRTGDRVVTSTLEHPAVLASLRALARRAVDVDVVDVGQGDDEDRMLGALGAAIQPATRLVVVSHVAWANGALLPVARIAELVHARGALLAVDGAQAAGAIRVDVGAIGADFYAASGYKWLLGPSGIGVLAKARGRSDDRPVIGDGSGFYRPAVLGLARSVGWLSMYVGLEWIHRRGQSLARRLADRLRSTTGVTVLTPADRMATLVAFRIAEWPAEDAADELRARTFAIVSTLSDADAIRASVGFYNTEDELDRFASAVELLAGHTPATMPARRRLEILGQES
ncbi:MAG: aminotransferase class V-fold PLP-dependent enzyme [Chloroflexota bacterium]